MHQTVDVCRKVSGKIWHRNPTPSSDNGLMVVVSNIQSGALSGPGRNVRFLHSAFDKIGDSFIAGDHQGHIYLFDIAKNRFALVQKTGIACTALAFHLRRRTEFLAALSDYSLKCFDTDTKEMVAWMKGHESAIHDISVHASGRYALTTSADMAQLWDLDTFQRKRKLNIKEDVGIVEVFFLPLSNTIITCFKDDTIFAWESDTLKCKYQLPVPPGKSPQYKAYASTRDGRLLVAGGRSRFVHVWSLDTQRLLQIVELPNKVTTVKQLEFLADNFDGGSSQVLGVLSQDGIMRFINVNTCKLLFDIGSLENRILNVSVSSTGRHVTGVMEDGNLHIFNVHVISSELNKPPAPLVKVVKENKMSETISTQPSDQTSSTIPRKKSDKNKKNRSSFNDTTFMDLPDGLHMDRLLAILRGYGEYPAKYRMFIWRSVLRLPENHTAYAALVDKGTHSSYAKLHEQYPIKSRKLLRILQRILSVLGNWSPIFGETQYLPVLSFPFVKLFQNNHLVCFEIIATIMTNWAQHWFEYFPNPPINVLSMVENLLAHHDHHLLQHFVKYNVTSQATLASECLQASVPYTLCEEKQDDITHIDPFLVSIQETELQSEFQQATCSINPKVQELHNFYNTQCASIETQRCDAVTKLKSMNTCNSVQFQQGLCNIHFFHDRQRMHLTKRVTASLQLLKIHLPAHSLVSSQNRTKSRQLNARAVTVMTDWYEKNINHPYPSDEDKQMMTEEGNISLSQVKAWFANKRNRSSNTKPKKQKQITEKKLQDICSELTVSSHKTPRLYGDIIKQLSDIVNCSSVFSDTIPVSILCDTNKFDS